MVSIDKSVVAKLKREGKTYEILVDAENAHALRTGKSVSMGDVVVTEEIFYDAKKGTRASENEFKKIFGTEDKFEICKIIVKNGDVPLTAEMKRKELDTRRKQIVTMIHRNVVDPKTGKPHPPQRIDAAMDEAKVRVDEYKSAEQQVQDVIDQIRKIIPIKYEVREISVRILSQYAGRAFPILKKFGKVLNESWENDGSLRATIEIPAGIQEELEIALNNIAKGTVEMKIVRTR